MNSSGDKYSKWEQEIISLAAVAQCAALVDTLATSGSCNEVDLVVSVNSLLVFSPDSFDDIYPNVVELAKGLRTLTTMFSNDRNAEKPEIVRYTLSLLQLRNSLMQNDDMQGKIKKGLENVEPLVLTYSTSHDDDLEAKEKVDRTIDQLASLYKETISTLNYRIQVQGGSEFLKDEQIAKKIRALLLAGIRAAVLWHQVGGRRWRLLFYRSRIQQTADRIRKSLLN